MGLLAPNALSGKRVAVSASPSEDLARLGLTEEHFRLVLAEVARIALTLGGGLQYCGHLAPEGYTSFLLDEVQRYGRRDDPVSVLLAWSVHRTVPLGEIRSASDQLGLLGTIRCLDVDGSDISCGQDRGEEPPGLDVDPGESLTSMRRRAASESHGRILVGGRRTGYQGRMPGVVEEALYALEGGAPLYIAGGFGGAAYDILRVVEPSATEWFPADVHEDPGLTSGLESLRSLVDGRSWAALHNGLSPRQNGILAATHRPSDIAALVALGMSRVGAGAADADG